MKKETLLLSNITTDLKTVVNFQIVNIGNWRVSYIIPITLLSISMGVLLKSIWIAILIFSVAAYHIVRFIIEYRNYSVLKKAVINTIDRSDICIATEKLSHIATETIYEPHIVGKKGLATKTAKYYYFESGNRWRVPTVDKHYKWSNNYCIGPQGLKNISIQGDEFYFISLQRHHDIAYIYPCKNFELEAAWEKDR